MAPKKRSLLFLSQKISEHLKRLEADPDYNTDNGTGYYPLGLAHAYVAGRYIGIRYKNFQGASRLTQEQADNYLTWLDAGNKGKHWTMLTDKAERMTA